MRVTELIKKRQATTVQIKRRNDHHPETPRETKITHTAQQVPGGTQNNVFRNTSRVPLALRRCGADWESQRPVRAQPAPRYTASVRPFSLRKRNWISCYTACCLCPLAKSDSTPRVCPQFCLLCTPPTSPGSQGTKGEGNEGKSPAEPALREDSSSGAAHSGNRQGPCTSS